MSEVSRLSVAEIAAYSLLATAVIGAFFAGIVSVIQAWRSMVGKIETVAKDTAVVLGHVNSEKSISEGEKNTLKAENALLREMLTEKRATAQLLAQAASHAVAAAPAPAAVADTSTLQKVERNTKDTADNTARTDAAVADLKEAP